MTKIGLIGYGKMGKTIHKMAPSYNSEVYVIISIENGQVLTTLKNNVDVALEFSSPDSAVEHIRFCMENGIPLVCGTTGWWDRLDEVKSMVNANNGALLYAGNFSIGMNIVFSINAHLSKIMNAFPQYKALITETHHTEKKDAPSGTAIQLAEGIINNNQQYSSWSLSEENNKIDDRTLSIESIRKDDIAGVHRIQWTSNEESIELKHSAGNREIFASGALMAALWIKDKKGIFTMEDLFKY